MRILNGLGEPASVYGGAIAIGNFDGVHRGHQQMIKMLRNCATRSEVPAVVFTFDPHPVRVLRPEIPHPSLSSLEHKLELLEGYGVDTVVVMPTTRDLLDLSPQEFFAEIVVGKIRASGLIEGPNFRFGRDRSGNVQTLKQLCGEHGLQLEIVEPIAMNGALVSSSRIREQIVIGAMGTACEMLGHPYQLSGTIVAGARRGRALGFPTANLDNVLTMIPGDGVYAGRAMAEDGWFTAAISVGTNPTFGGGARTIEAHLLDFHGDLYGRTLRIEFHQRIRDTQSFASVELLKSQLSQDIHRVRQVVANQG
jgi:riboflavin kinase/FMN adenylyltransferase